MIALEVGREVVHVTQCVGGSFLRLVDRYTGEVGGIEWCRHLRWSTLTHQAAREVAMGFFDRVRKTEGNGSGGQQLQDEKAAKLFPTLLEVLQARMEGQWGDTNRVSLSVFTQDGLFKAILKDKQERLALWVSAKTFEQLWKSLELALNDPDVVWREDRYQGYEQARRKKK